MSEDIKLNGFERLTRAWLQHYHEKKYWKRRGIVIDPHSRVPKLLRAYYLFYIKRSDAFNNATMGTHLGMGARFASIPQLPHGLYGIMVSHNAVIGNNCRIYHQVTIGEGKHGAPTIGDDVVLGAGCKLIGDIKIGNHVTVAPNAVVMEDIPDYASVFPGKCTVVIREKEHL